MSLDNVKGNDKGEDQEDRTITNEENDQRLTIKYGSKRRSANALAQI